MTARVVVVAKCKESWQARRKLKFYAEPFEPTPFGPDSLTYRVEPDGEGYAVVGRNKAAMEALSAS